MDNASLANEALSHYPIEVTSVEFVGQSGSTVYKVTDSRNHNYCLRLYRAKNNALDSKWTSKSAIHSELQWVNALSIETDLAVPAPYKNNHGEFITDVDGVLCTLVKWLEGEHKPYVQNLEDAGHIGEMIAKMHRQASTWRVPSDFSRPSFDSSCITSALQKLDKATALDLKKGCLDGYKKAAQKVITLLNSLEKNRQTWGVIHCDIMPPNFLFYKQEVRPIDFGACGFGFYLWDIGILFSFTPLQFRDAVFESYSKHFKLPGNYVELTEAFFVGAKLEVLNFFLELPDVVEWLPNEMDKLSGREFLHYINDESFLFHGTPYWE